MSETMSKHVDQPSRTGLGLALGMSFGAAFGQALWGDAGTGVVVGMLVGLLIGTLMDARAQQGLGGESEEPGDSPAPPHSMTEEPREGIEGLDPRGLFRAALARVGDAGSASADPAAAERSAEEEARVRAEIEERLPGLEVIELLGRGGMGYVYRTRQPKLDREVALKVVAPGVEGQADFAERFAREARAMARLSHPNIVAVHDYGQDGSFCWLLMEYVDGSNLRDVIRAGKLEPAEALALVPKICDALQYAHDQGVVHRDVKPENILLDRAGGVKIADFGLAKLTGTPATLAGLTGSQQVLGTFRYMAPEQLDRPLEVDHRADIYSLGVVFYEMLTGEIPMGRFDPPSQHSTASPGVDEVVLRALAKEPERRYQHASEVKSGLQSVEHVARTPRTVPAQGAPRLSLNALGAASLAGVGALPFALSVAAFVVARLDSVDRALPGDAPRSMSFAAIFMVLLCLVGLGLLFAGRAVGVRALDELREGWPRRYGAALAVFGAWAGILLVANAVIMVAGFAFWDVPGEIDGEAPGFTALILLVGDAAFLVWYRLRFLEQCRDD